MRESVSAIFVHEDEIFLIDRQANLRAFPGYTSFPGGKVDKEDHAESFSQLDNLIINKSFSREESYILNALTREIREELDFDIINSLVKGNISQVDLLGVAITPDFNPHRFKNYYVKIHLREKPTFKLDEGEIKSAYWKNSKDAFMQYEAGEMLVVPPMITILEHLSNNLHSTQEIDPNLQYDGSVNVPLIESVCGVKQLLPLSNTFPPANRTNCFLIGDEKKVLIDPSPKNIEEYAKLKATIFNQTKKVDVIFLTHHHPDHHEFAPYLARELSVSMMMSEDTHTRLLSKKGDDYFKGIKVKFMSEGDLLTISKGEKVHVIHTPGHDEGQLSLLREDGAWCIVSDLIQTVGTVVIGGDEGDMNKYFKSLRRVIDLNPRFIYPSHGIALGGVDKLKVTLEHRLLREAHIEKLLAKKLDRDAMLAEIYPDLPVRLHPYALLTIDAHIAKLNNHGAG